MKEENTLLEESLASPEVLQAYNQLHAVIDNLDIHVQDLIKRHQGQFILAYRNHLLKVKDELALLKKKNQEQERQNTGVTKIDKLERQVALFREETLKVYNNYEEKKKEYEDCKIKYMEAEETILRHEESIKELTRRMKGIQVRKKELEFQLQELQREDPQQSTNKQFNKQSKEAKEGKERKEPPITPYQSMRATGILSQTNFALQQLLKNSFPNSTQQQLKGALVCIGNLIKARQNDLTNRFQSFKKKQLLSQIADSQAMSYELKEWFLDCIKTVKKQIHKRNPNIEKEKRDIESVKSIDQFLRIDKLRLLELFVSDERLLSFIYNKLFPDRVTEMQNYLLKKKEEEEEAADKELQEEYKQHFQEVQKPKVILPKNKKKKESMRNRVVIKDGKLNLNN